MAIFNQTGDFAGDMKRARNIHWNFTLILGIVVYLWYFKDYFINGFKLNLEMGDYTGMIISYGIMLLAGFGIWYGNYNYDKIANIMKPKESLEAKQAEYLKAKDFQFILLACSMILSALLYFVMEKNVYLLVFTICFIFSLIQAPSNPRFENDFFEPQYLDDEFNQAEEEETENK